MIIVTVYSLNTSNICVFNKMNSRLIMLAKIQQEFLRIKSNLIISKSQKNSCHNGTIAFCKLLSTIILLT